MAKPLERIRILDVTNVLAGPFACQQLAHLGADVIKVEMTGRGDLARQLGADPDLNRKGMGVSFLAQNAGKRSVTIDLKSEKGRELFTRLAATADVVVENFRPGVMDRLGVGYEQLREVRPDVVYCAISGFGQDGPWRDRPAYDQIVQGVAGVMAITGDADSGPLRVGFPVADTISGLTAAMAIAAALNQEPRGGFIDVSMLESILATMGWAASNYLVTGVAPERHGNENVTSAPSGAFRTATGPLNIAANKDEQWTALAGHLGRADLVSHPDYRTREDRKANRYALSAELETILVTKPAQTWAEELNQIGVPAAPVQTVPEALAMPQVVDRGFLHTFTDVPDVDGEIVLPTAGLLVDGERPRAESPPPRLGQHGAEVWSSLGLSAEEIADLEAGGVI